MNKEQLNRFLYRVTPSEQWHQAHPGILSDKYKHMSITTVNDRKVYLFHFHSILKEGNIAIHKESRWTSIPPHIHAVIEIMYVYHGSCTQNINGTAIHMKEGDLCMLDQNVLHSIGPIGADDILIGIELRKEYISEYLLSNIHEQGPISTFLIEALSMKGNHDGYLLFPSLSIPARSAMSRLLCEYFDPQLYSDLMVNAYMVLLLCHILRQFHDQPSVSLHGENAVMVSILKTIETNPTISLNALAAQYSFHPNYLSALIHEKTGYTFKQLTILQRMRTASYYLASTDRPIYEIAEEAGYNNLGFFYKKFRQIYHLSPQEYRTKYQQESA